MDSFNKTLGEIKKLLNTTKVISYQNDCLNIQEVVNKTKKGALKEISLVNAGSSSFFIKFDLAGFPSKALFVDDFALHRACDAIAFCIVNHQPCILCLELKSSEPDRAEVAEQFRNAQCFLKYLDILLATYCDCDSIKNWSCQYFVFHNQGRTPLSVAPIGRSRVNVDNLTPETARFVPTENGKKFNLHNLLRIAN